MHGFLDMSTSLLSFPYKRTVSMLMWCSLASVVITILKSYMKMPDGPAIYNLSYCPSFAIYMNIRMIVTHKYVTFIIF